MKKVHPFFILLFLWFVVTGKFVIFAVYFCAILLHELGHGLVARHLGYKLNKFYLAPYGVSLNYRESNFNVDDEIIIAAAGPFVNICIAIITICSWWLFPVLYSFTADFVTFNIVLAGFNLLPAYPLDGGRVFVSLLSKIMTRERAYKFSAVFNVIFAVIFALMFVYSCFIDVNITLILTAIFLILGLMDTKFEGKYERMVPRFGVSLKRGAKVSFTAVNSEMPLFRAVGKCKSSKFNVMFVVFPGGRVKMIHEETLKGLIILYGANKSIGDALHL